MSPLELNPAGRLCVLTTLSFPVNVFFVTVAHNNAPRIIVQGWKRINPLSPPQHGEFLPSVATLSNPHFPAELDLSPKEIRICIQPSSSPHGKS